MHAAMVVLFVEHRVVLFGSRTRNSWCSRRSTVVKEGFPVFMVALIKLLIQSYGKLIHDVLLIVEMAGEAVEDEDLAVGVPHVRSVNDQGQTNIRSWRLGSRSQRSEILHLFRFFETAIGIDNGKLKLTKSRTTSRRPSDLELTEARPPSRFSLGRE